MPVPTAAARRDDSLLPMPTPDRRPLVTGERLVLLASIALVWLLAWSYPLLPPDEGRYGSVSATMAEHGRWFLPEFRGKPHLTKPPLAYWLQGLGVTAFGRTELAVRWPSLLATSLGLVVLFRFARTALGTRPAVFAVGVAAVMPIVLFVGRLANTDALLALAWLVMLAQGHSVATSDRQRPTSLLAFWSALAAGLLIKGPAALGPVLIIGAWLALAGRWSAIQRFQPFIGFPVALLPAGLWVGYVLSNHPDVRQLWWDETFGRVTGEKSLRAEPWWFYLPIYLAGMYPATVMLVLPWTNIRWRTVWAVLSGGDLRGLLVIAVLFPLLGLSISTGKMPTYLLPLAAPTAMLVAITLERWIGGSFDRKPTGSRPPDVRITLFVVSACIFLGQIGGAIAIAHLVPELWALAIPLAIAPLACGVLWWMWSRGGSGRWQGLAVAWVGLAASWTIVFGLQTRYATPMGAKHLLAETSGLLALDRPQIVTIGFVDPTIAFYNGGQPTLELEHLGQLRDHEFDRYPALVLVRASRLEELMAPGPDIAHRLDPLATWTRWFASPTKVFALRPPGDATPLAGPD